MPEPIEPPGSSFEEPRPTGREAEVLAARRASLERLGRERAFAVNLHSVLDVDEPTSTRVIREANPDLAPDTTTAERFVVAGRVMLKRDLGKLKFVTVRDRDGAALDRRPLDGQHPVRGENVVQGSDRLAASTRADRRSTSTDIQIEASNRMSSGIASMIVVNGSTPGSATAMQATTK